MYKLNLHLLVYRKIQKIVTLDEEKKGKNTKGGQLIALKVMEK